MKIMKRAIVAVGLSVSGLMAGGSLPVIGSVAASAATARNCVSAQIVVTHGASQGTAGTIYYPLVFTNTGATCAIFGVPTVQPVVGSTHHKVGPMARNLSMGEMPARHVIAKGQSVSVAFGVVETGNYTPSTCVARSASGVMVALGDFVHSTYVHLAIIVCTKRIIITTRLITVGTTGN